MLAVFLTRTDRGLSTVRTARPIHAKPCFHGGCVTRPLDPWSPDPLCFTHGACTSSPTCLWNRDGYITSQASLEDVRTGDMVQPTIEARDLRPTRGSTLQVELVGQRFSVVPSLAWDASTARGGLPSQTVSLPERDECLQVRCILILQTSSYSTSENRKGEAAIPPQSSSSGSPCRVLMIFFRPLQPTRHAVQYRR